MYTTVPSLKRPNGKAIKPWIEEIAKFVSGNMSLYTSTNVRASVRDKLINLDLYNNKLHVEDFVSLLNPLDLKTIDDTREIQHFPVAASIIDLMVGEEIDRPFEPMVDITNNVGIEEKRERLKNFISNKLAELEKEFQGDEETLKQEVKKFTRYLRYTYKDVIEKKASALLEHYYENLRFTEKFIEGFRRVWLTGEEAYEIDIDPTGEPTVEVLNTANVRLYGGGRSNRFQDYDLIVTETHPSPGYLIDRYGSQLTDEEVERILNYETNSGLFDKTYGNVSHEFVPVGDILGTEISDNFVDASGGMRHLRIRFKAYKKVKKVGYQDPTDGSEQVKVVANNYKVLEGEALIETIWITEWWIVTLIGADIIVDAHPIPIRYNRLSSLQDGHPGVVGRIYNVNEREVIPPMTKIRPFQYLYDTNMDRVIVAMSKNVGPILEMDFAKRPAKWGTMKWLDYMFKYNTKFIDNFKEVAKGKHTGQLAGNLASGRDQQQHFDFSNYIQQLLNIAEYLEKAMADTLGVVPQRMGAVNNRETVGGVERATSQSSHITEWYFYQHEQVKLEVLNVFIEAAKTGLKDNPKKLEYMLDKAVIEVLSVTEDDFANNDLGVRATNSKKSQEYRALLTQGAQAFMQNGGDFSFIFDVINSNSMAEKRRLIEEYEDERKDAAREEAANQQKQVETQVQGDVAKHKETLASNEKIAEAANLVKVELARVELQAKESGMDITKTKTLADIKNDILSLQAEIDQNHRENKLAERELDIKEKQVAVQAKKPATSKTT